jgi:hypothetical protein
LGDPGALFGAALRSKLLYVLQYVTALQAQPIGVWFSGKTIVGGLLGGLIGVELAKRSVGWRHSGGVARNRRAAADRRAAAVLCNAARAPDGRPYGAIYVALDAAVSVMLFSGPVSDWFAEAERER